MNNLETIPMKTIQPLTNRELLWRRQIAEDILKSRVILQLFLFVAIVQTLLISILVGCFVYFLWRIFLW